MVTWRKYKDLEPIRRLRNEGRELLGQLVDFTEKRDGENVSIWMDDSGIINKIRKLLHLQPRFKPVISSHNMKLAENNIVSRLKNTPEYKKALLLLTEERKYKPRNWILYGELLKTVSPTRIEPKRKHIHWILFDIYDCDEKRYLGYNFVYQKAHHYKIPVVKLIDSFIPSSLDELFVKRDELLKWCKRHRREGIVGKNYKNQIMFKEKIDLPKRPKIRTPTENQIQLPTMPPERILRALQHAYDIVGEENWKDKSKAMPIVAQHISVEAKEHNYSTPRNFYKWYINTPLEDLKP